MSSDSKGFNPKYDDNKKSGIMYFGKATQKEDYPFWQSRTIGGGGKAIFEDTKFFLPQLADNNLSATLRKSKEHIANLERKRLKQISSRERHFLPGVFASFPPRSDFQPIFVIRRVSQTKYMHFSTFWIKSLPILQV